MSDAAVAAGSARSWVVLPPARVTCFVEAWNRWISDDDAVRVATAEGEGIIVTHRGADPFAATTGLRVAWA